MSGDEFDRIMSELDAPDYPATCDLCGRVGPNAGMAQHECVKVPDEASDFAYILHRWTVACRQAMKSCPLEFMTQLTDLALLGNNLILQASCEAAVRAYGVSRDLLKAPPHV
jgi:hypothetical protein